MSNNEFGPAKRPITLAPSAGNGADSTEPSAEQVDQLLDVLAAGDVQITINGLEGVLARLRPALAAREELREHVSPRMLKAALELRRNRVARP